MHKNTLYITFDGLSDPLGQSQILPYLIGIAKNGYHITILSCEKKERLEAEKNKIDLSIKNLPIDWQYILYDEDGGFLSRIHYIRKIGKLADTLRQEKTISLTHCRSYLASLIGLRLKKRYKIPFVFDMRGFWADERIDGQIWKKTNPLHFLFYLYFKRKEKQFLEASDAIISLTHAAVSELSKNFGNTLIQSKTTVIPCCTNTALFDRTKLTSENLIPELSINDHLLIYTGSIGTWYSTRELIDCVLVWKKKIPALKLLFLTKDIHELEKIVENYSAEDKSMLLYKSASYQEVSKYLALAKAAIFFIKPVYSKIASSPTKMAECWAMNLPIITNAGIGDNDLYFHHHKGGILIKDFSPEAYQNACTAYLELQDQTADYRKIALDHFDNSIAIQRYSDVYKKCCL